jgi:hypothetical protein
LQSANLNLPRQLLIEFGEKASAIGADDEMPVTIPSDDPAPGSKTVSPK